MSASESQSDPDRRGLAPDAGPSDPDLRFDAGAGAPGQPSEAELQAAYEAELRSMTSADLVFQATASLLSIGGRRLGLAPGAEGERDLEQVRDAIDAVRALLPILERRGAPELRMLRDALSQLQIAYARETPQTGTGAGAAAAAAGAAAAPQQPAGGAPAGGDPGAAEKPAGDAPGEPNPEGPGPAESSGRLWVPGR